MARRVIGMARDVTGRWPRRWGMLLSFVVAVGAGVTFVQTVLAVHDTGRFGLEGDTVSVGAVDDWDRVCYEATGGSTVCNADGPTTGQNPDNTFGAKAVSWTGDCEIGSSGVGCSNPNATIFTGGGSKDPQNVDQWAWKDGAGGLPDKDNLVHAFAARYSMESTGATGGTCPSGSFATCEVIYFGSDRFDNSGDAQQGFWFMQNKISLDTNAVGGGQGFKGLHKNGDLLVISDFSNGGTTSTITVFKWDTTCLATDNSKNPPPQPCADANLRRLRTSNAALCGGSTGDPFCGIVNTVDGTATSWSGDYTDKSGNNSYLAGEFYEAGVNLSTLNLGNECFSSVVSETRSSTSTTATLKDFVLGDFAVCGATLTTTPSVGAGAFVNPGTSVTDTAVVVGTGTSNPPTPTGSVTFFVCGPTAADSTALCTSGGTQVGTPKALVDSAPPPGEATAISAATAPTAPGRYCFRAEWPGDSNYTGPFSHAGTAVVVGPPRVESSECFTVRQLPTSTVTTPSDGSGVPLSSPVAFGTTLYDKAVVTGDAAIGAPAGTVAFFICKPNELTAGTCSTGGTAVGTPTLTAANPPTSPPSSSALSNGTVGNIAGTWCFRAVYTPSGTGYIGSSDATVGECVEVSKAPTTTVTTPKLAAGGAITGALAVGTSVVDTAIVTGSAADGTPTGTVNFFVCGPSALTPADTGLCSTGGTAAGSITAAAVAASSPPQSSATSNAITANVVGRWCFRAEYVPGGTNGGNYTGSSDSSTTECFNVQDSTDITSAQNWLPNDTATVAAAGSTALNGSLKFTLYPNAGCTGTALIAEESFPLVNASTALERTKTTTNQTFTVSASTTVYWKVVFESTDSKVTGKETCKEQTQLTISNNVP